MRRLFSLFAMFCCLVVAPGAEATSSPVVAYVHAHWWDGRGFVDGDRYVREGVFIARPAAAADQTVDLGGAYVVPPFADAHNHMAGRAAEVSDKAVTAGVFYLMNPTLMASLAPGIRTTLAQPGRVEAVLSMGAITAPGGHPEGLYQDVLRKYVYPNMSPADFVGDAFHYVSKPADIEPVLDRLSAQHAQFVKIMLLFSEEFARRRDDPSFREHKGLDPKLVPLIVRAAHRRGLRVAAHIETAADFRVIVAAGVDEAAHMPGYFAGEGPMSEYAITPADARAAARAGIKVVATASYALHGQDPARLPEIQAMQRANLLALKRAGVPILIGTDGAPDAAISEARYLVDLGVFSPVEALASLSETTPRFIFPGRRIGVLKPGNEASFLVLAADPTHNFDAVRTIVRGVKLGRELPALVHTPTLAVTHVTVVSMANAREAADQTILMSGARILAIGRGLAVPAGVQGIDGRGAWAIPGLWDMHVHVLSQGVEADRLFQTLLRNGVVGVRDMGSTLDDLKALRRPASAPPWPEVIAAGPVVNGPATPWSLRIEDHVATPAEAEAEVDRLANGGGQFIKVYSGLDPATYQAVVRAAHDRGLAVAGHLPFALDLDQATAAGQRSIEHMEVHLSKSCGATAPGAVAQAWLDAWIKGGLDGRDREELALRANRDPARCAALLKRMAAAHLWWTPTLTLDFRDGSFADADFKRFATADDVKDCADYAPRVDQASSALRHQALDAELADVAMIHAAGVPLLAGTDMPHPCAAPVASLWRELDLLVRAGLSPYEALRAATVEPARYLDRPDAGTLEAGKTADIVLLEADPLADIGAVRRVSGVIRAGQALPKP